MTATYQHTARGAQGLQNDRPLAGGRVKPLLSLLGSVLFATLFVLSITNILISGSFAWTAFSQDAYNEAFGISTDVKLLKLEKDTRGDITTKTLGGAQFYLYKVVDTHDVPQTISSAGIGGGPSNTVSLQPPAIVDDIQIGSLYTTSADGYITVSNLVPGDYYFYELRCPAYHEWDKDNKDNYIVRYDFSITGTEEADKVVSVAYNRQIPGSLSIEKTVIDLSSPGSHGNPGVNPNDDIFDFTITLTGVKDGPITAKLNGIDTTLTCTNGKIDTQLKHGDILVLTDLPQGASYQVTEAPVAGYITASNGHSGTIVAGGAHAKFTNEKTGDSNLSYDIEVEKRVFGQLPATEADREFSFRMIIDGVEQIFTLKDRQVKRFEDVSAGVVYELIEDDYSGIGYVSSVTNGFGTVGSTAAGSDGVIHIVQTNIYLEPESTTIAGEKTWDLGEYQVQLPDFIRISLIDGTTVVDTAVVQADETGKWQYAWTAPKYRADGVTEIVYTVKEEPVEGFDPRVTGFDICNVYVCPVVVGDPPVEKRVASVEGDLLSNTLDNIKGVFSFTMRALDGGPMPEGSVDGVKHMTIVGSGSQDFGDITFTRPGTFNYLISEINTGEAGYSYDNAVYLLKFVIEKQDSKLVVAERTVSVSESLGEVSAVTQVEDVVFTNTYVEPGFKPPVVEPKPTIEPKPAMDLAPSDPAANISDKVQTGDSNKLMLWFILLEFSQFGLLIIVIRKLVANRCRRTNGKGTFGGRV